MTTASRITNQHGRPFDDLDIIKLRCGARDASPAGCSYAVESADGRPMLGFVADPPTPVTRLTARHWRGRVEA